MGRDEILAALKAALEPLEYVHAMWEGGAISFGRTDEMSDIDLYVDVEDSRVADVFPVVEEALERVSGIKLKYEVPLPPSNPYAQAFYRLKGASEFLLVDLAVMRHGAEDKFLEPEIHGKALFHFNKANAVRIPKVDGEKLRSPPTWVTALAELLAGSPSGRFPFTSAVLVISPAAEAVVTIVIVTEPVLSIVPRLQMTTRFWFNAQFPWLAVAETKVSVAGSGSWTVTPPTPAGPLLVTVKW